MKSIEPKIGEEFESIKKAIDDCDKAESYCRSCPISIANNHKGLVCKELAREYPAEAARLMGI